MPMPRADPSVTAGVAGAARRRSRSAASPSTASSSCASSTRPTKVARLADGGEMPFDLFLGVPVHRVPPVVEESGMTVDGWIPVDPSHARDVATPTCTRSATSRASAPRRRACSPRARRWSSPTPIIARARGERRRAEYDGRGICYLEFGNERGRQGRRGLRAGPAARRATSSRRRTPSWPTSATSAASRIQRWFGRDLARVVRRVIAAAVRRSGGAGCRRLFSYMARSARARRSAAEPPARLPATPTLMRTPSPRRARRRGGR